MNTINTLLVMAVIIIFLGVYLLYISMKMKKSKKVERLVIAEETMMRCKDEKAFAEFLAQKMTIFSIGLIIIGVILMLHETIFDLGYAVYLLVIAALGLFAWFQKNLTDGRNKFC